MTVKGVATIALLTIIALMGSSNANARTRYKRMDPNCIATGKVINRLLDIIEALEDRVTKLKAHKPAWAAKIRKWIDCQKAQIFLAKRKWLKGEIAKLKKQLAQLKSSKMDPDARRAAIRALKRKIAKYQKELAALKAKLALLPLCPSARPVAGAAAARTLAKALDGLSKALDRLIAQWKAGLKVDPALLKRLDRLLIAHKLTQSYLVDVTAELSALRRQLKKGIRVRPADSGPKPIWAGWHFRAGPLVGFTALNGSGVLAVRLQLDLSAEWVDYKTHLGVRFGLAMGGLFTRAIDDQGGRHLVFPFLVTGHVAAVAAWKWVSIILPEISASFVQNPLDGQQGWLWVQAHAGLEVHAYRAISVSAMIGTSLHGEDQRLTGLSAIFRIQYTH